MELSTRSMIIFGEAVKPGLMRSRLLLLLLVSFVQFGNTQVADALPGCLNISNQQGMMCGGGSTFFGINGLGQFEVNNIDGIMCCATGGDFNAFFEFETVDISCYSNVSIAFDYSAMGNFEDNSPGMPVFGCTGSPVDNSHDQIVFTYSLDGGPEIQDLYVHGTTAADFTGQWNAGVFNGNTLDIKVYVSNKASAEHFYFENLVISGTAASPSAGPDISICGGSVMLMGSGTGTWSGGMGTFSNINDPTATYTPAPSESGTITLTYSCGAASSTCPGGATDDMDLMISGSNVMATLTSMSTDLCVGDCLDVTFSVTGGSGGPYDLTFDVSVPPLPSLNVPIVMPGAMQNGFLCTTSSPIPSYDAASNTLFIPDFLSSFTITLVSVSEGGCNGTVNATPLMFNVVDPPTANTGCTLEDCVIPGTTSNFDLTNAEPCVNGTAGMGFLWFSDLAMTMPIANPSNYPITSNTTVYVLADDGVCQSPLVAVDLIIFSITAPAMIVGICNDGGTPTDPLDDYITFDLDPQGGAGMVGMTYTVTVSSGTVTPSMGVYGSPNSFQLQVGSAGAGSVVITVTDNNYAGCIIPSITLIDPGPCSSACQITTTGLINVMCNDNGTASDATDDFITFDLNPTGVNNGTTYMVFPSSGTIIPSTGAYGITSTFTMQLGSAGAGDFTITIIDGASATCTLTEIVVDPGNCAVQNCGITDENIFQELCGDNNTGWDPTDDFWTFGLDPTGINLGTTYSIAVSTGSIVPAFGTYGQGTIFQLQNGSAAGGPVTVTIVDDTDPLCMHTFIVTPTGSCSDNCLITDMGLDNVICNSNGTLTDDSDDYITFTINPTGNALTGNYDLNVVTVVGSMMIGITPNTGNYSNGVSVFTLQLGSAGIGDLILTVDDAANPGCSFEVVIMDPGSCSNNCSLTTTITDIICDANGTPSDDSDDTFTFIMDVTGSNVGAMWSANDPTSNTNMYNSATLMGPYPIANGDLNFVVSDIDDPSCSQAVNVMAPATCSNFCNMVVNVNTIVCNDNGTDMDPDDDTFTFTVVVVGSNTGMNWTADDPNATTGAYGVPVMMGPYPIGLGGLFNFTIFDDNDPSCFEPVDVIMPATCSGACVLNVSILGFECDNGGTASDTSDDSFTIEVIVSGQGTGWIADDILSSSGSYGVSTIMGPYLLSAGDLAIDFSDDTDPSCVPAFVIYQVPICNFPCEMETSGLAEINCEDGGTPNDTSDDFVTFVLNPTGGTLAASGYMVIGLSGITPTTGFYGQNTIFSLPAGSATGGFPISLTIVDNDDNGCTFPIEITDPGNCATPCTQNFNTGMDQSIDCINMTADLEAISSEVPTFIEWLDPMGMNVGSSLNITVSEGGIYTINVSYADGCTATGTVTVTDNSLTAPDASIIGPMMPFVDCNVGSVELFSASVPGVTYTWTYSGGVVNGGSLEVFSADVVTLTAVDDATGCTDSSMLTITDLSDNPNIIIEPVQTLCLNGSIILDATNSDAFDGFWADANGVDVSDGAAGLSQIITEDGWYYFTLVNASNGCTSIDSIEVNSENPPGVGLTISSNTNALNVFDLLGIPTGVTTSDNYQWTPAEGLSCTDCPNPIATITETTEYTLTYFFGESCSMTETVVLAYEVPFVSVYVPNAFSPNGDGINDEIGIFSSSEAMVEIFYIYDRWGERVFEAENYSTLTNNQTWNGRFKNSKLNPAVFVYQIVLIDSNGDEKILYGDITLTR